MGKKLLIVLALISAMMLLSASLCREYNEESGRKGTDILLNSNWSVINKHSESDLVWPWTVVFSESSTGGVIDINITQTLYGSKTIYGTGWLDDDSLEFHFHLRDANDPGWSAELVIPVTSITSSNFSGHLDVKNSGAHFITRGTVDK